MIRLHEIDDDDDDDDDDAGGDDDDDDDDGDDDYYYYPRAMLVTEIGGARPQMKLFSTSYFILFVSHVS